MKIITKCVIDIKTLKIIEEESYEYSGPSAKCKGGSGGGGGGGSGQVGYPGYIERIHEEWLDNSGGSVITTTMTDVMNAALGNSPFLDMAAYDPDAEITSWETSIANYAAILADLNDIDDWENFFDHTTSSTSTVINNEVDAFADQLDDEIDTKVLPKFRRGMQDINAVVSSAFVIGEAIIMGFRDREVAKHSSALRVELGVRGTEQMIQMMARRIGWEEAYAKLAVESNRIKIVAKKEEVDQEMDIEEKDSLWDLKVFQYGANLMAAPGGGVAVPDVAGPSKAQSAIGGALAGAAGGAVVGSVVPGIGTAVGAIAGGVLGGASAFL